MAEDGREDWKKNVLDLLTKLERTSRSLPSEVSHQTRGKTWLPVTCKVQCEVRGLGEIDTVKQTFEADVRLRFGWIEEDFQGRPEQDIAWDECWDPRIYFPNAVTIDERERQHFIQTFDDDVTWAYLSIRMKAVFKTVMNLEWFPCDRQNLTIKVMSNWPKELIQFEQDDQKGNNIFTDSYSEKNEWFLHDKLTVQSEKKKKTPYPMHVIGIHVTRKVSYYMVNIAFVNLLILLLNFTTFAITPSAPGDRLSISVTLLLTAMTFQSAVSSNLPKIPYFTLMDQYILMSLIMQCAVVAENALVVIAPEKNRHLIDFLSFAAILALVLSLNVFFTIIVTMRGIFNVMTIVISSVRARIIRMFTTTTPRAPPGSGGDEVLVPSPAPPVPTAQQKKT